MLEYNHKYPVNYINEWKNLFKKDLKFNSINLKTKTLHNVFVNHYGLVLKNGILNKNCAPNLKFDSYDDNKYFKHWKLALEQYLVCRFGKSLKYKVLSKEKKYLVIHSPWFSYYFWITECLPRLLRTLEKFDVSEFTLIFPENWKNLDFVNKSLENIPNLQTELIENDTHLFVPNLILTDVKPWTPMFIPTEVAKTREFLFKISNNAPFDIEENCRVYISRASAKRRKFTNEEDVEILFKKYNFKIVEMEHLSFFQQIQLMKKTKYLAGLTGAGHINILFMKEGGGFLDLSNDKYKSKTQYKFHFFKLCNILNIGYSICFFKSENAPNIDHWSNQNLIANLGEIESELKKLIEHVEQS